MGISLRICSLILTAVLYLKAQAIKHLGVIFDSRLTFQSYIKAITKTALFHLCNIAKNPTYFIITWR